MKLLLLAFAIASSAPSEAADAKASSGQSLLQLRPKAAMASTSAHRDAPFVNPSSEPDLDLIPRRDPRHEQSRSSCEGERSLCYDPAAGRIVYKPARLLMPEIPGLQRENISIKRDRIVFRYTF
jgi:hypothetical protein